MDLLLEIEDGRDRSSEEIESDVDHGNISHSNLM